MNLYLDTSALVKLYIREPGSADMQRLLHESLLAATSWVGYVEVVSALTRAVRMKTLSRNSASRKLAQFQHQWGDLFHIEVTTLVITLAAPLTWEHELRAYDSLHLASALIWQETLAEPVTLATSDLQLWETARKVGLLNFPPAVPA
ncbi:MAG: VapC toxin family PIN domain ribonuclease [Chloroflexi bacterium]|nr:MAG: VapC toxin family PIN domain ribonuclease [Chloroflexota bacterium]